MDWYQSTFGGASPNGNMQGTPFVDVNQAVGADMPVALPMRQQQPAHALPQTPVSHGHARTVPNTPQSFVNNWPSPPGAHVKHARSQSFQLDVAPMADPTLGGHPQVFQMSQDNCNQDGILFANEQGYASSAYSSSVVDPMSPSAQYNQGHMPTLFEEPSPPLVPVTRNGFDDSSLLLQATAGSAPDFNDPDFDFHGPIPFSPGQALLNNLGPDVPASIVDTGIPSYEVQRYIGELAEADNKYPCLYEGCNRRFGRKENVRAHVQTHLGDRQFRCNLCDKTFVRQHDLKRHVAIHSDDRPFTCPCGTGFARHDALTRHRQRGMCHGALPGFEKNEEEKPKRGRPKKQRPEMEARVEKANKTRKNNKAKAKAADEAAAAAYASSSSGASDHSFPVTPPSTSDAHAFDPDAFLDLAGASHDFDDLAVDWRDTPPTSPLSASPTKTADSFGPNGGPGFDFNAPVNQGISPSVLSNHSPPPARQHVTTASSPPGTHDAFDYASPAASDHAGSSFHGGSSPVGDDAFLPDFAAVVHSEPNPGFDAFSPPGESNTSSSVYNSDGGEADPFGHFTARGAAAAATFTKSGAESLPSAAATCGEMDDMDVASRSLSYVLDEWLAAN